MSENKPKDGLVLSTVDFSLNFQCKEVLTTKERITIYIQVISEFLDLIERE